ncbi:TetR family transcriptional regulator C-terminal domain-containing protein [Streptomyces sp. MBT84]|uniref:TetR family transcriptional regulator C-terminal domain-containing protein n=1 Tax=Streptomyces sp. MBT84 TaxID=1488414 RepID=UPI0035ABCDBE
MSHRDRGAAELSGHAPEVRAISTRTFTALEDLLTDSLTAAQRAGHISAGADPRRLATLVLAVVRGIEAPCKGGSSPTTLRSTAETVLSFLPRP